MKDTNHRNTNNGDRVTTVSNWKWVRGFNGCFTVLLLVEMFWAYGWKAGMGTVCVCIMSFSLGSAWCRRELEKRGLYPIE